MSHVVAHIARPLGLAELAEELDLLGAGSSSEFAAATPDARDAARSIEIAIHDALGPAVGMTATLSLAIIERTLRLALVNCLGWDDALRIRKSVASPLQPLYVCRGNPVFGPERYDHLGPPGCGIIFRGQWRRSQLGRVGFMGREQVALGPRCKACRRRMSADLEKYRVRRRRTLGDST